MIRGIGIWVIFICCVLHHGFLTAQYEATGFTATGSAGMSTTQLHDYQAVGINPAAVGTGDPYKFAMGFLEGGFSIHSEALSRTNLSNLLISDDSVVITSGLKRKFGENFVGKGFSVDVNFMVAGFAFQAFKKVSAGFKVDVESTFRMRFNQFASNYYFLGYRYDDYFDQTTINSLGDTIGKSTDPDILTNLLQGSYLRGTLSIPVSSGFGFKLWSNENTNLYGGIGVKYVFGIAHLDFEVQNGSIQGRGSYNKSIPLGLQLINGRFSTTNNWNPAGAGLGFDVGAIYKYKTSLVVGASITDIGSVTWERNLFSINNVTLDSTNYGGANNLNFREAYESLAGNEEVLNEQIDPFTVSMPTQFRAGMSYKIGRIFRAGIDIILPLNSAPGNFDGPYIGAGANLNAFGLFNISAGLNYMQDYGFSFPVGFVYGSKRNQQYEAGLASRDLLSIFTEENPNISYIFGFLRFKF